MTKTLKTRIVTAAFVGVLSIATIPTAQATANWIETYRLGFIDGCDQARVQAGIPVSFLQSQRLPNTIEYGQGWVAGYDFCVQSGDPRFLEAGV